MTAPTGIRSKQLHQAGQIKYLWTHGWPIQRIQEAFPDSEYSTIRRTVVGAVNKAVASLAPEWFTTEEKK